MSRDLTPAAVIHRLDHGGSITIPASKKYGTLVLALVTGLFLLGIFFLMVRGGIEEGTSWALYVFNLRVWAFVVGILGCLVLAPIAVAIGRVRSPALVLTRDGIVETRRGIALPQTFLPWREIEGFVCSKPDSPGSWALPRTLRYVLTPEGALHCGLKDPNRRELYLRYRFALNHRRLFSLLVAAHARYSGRLHDFR
ncbi:MULTISPECIES: hypothetical protein [unclassified Brevibacterium]|uniref:hypothetical protein n=1 Tax=unclassified Brevibacterium TaxID=2614124 RepID=UPI001E4CB1AA|nr:MULTISPECIES: hypothetical protein [unclassified Brevibacterium]MCD1284500.1 hypothetical protein [Brevibacterium sp. CCUG 69071]MDK8435882.1 hypothetical protein [Brevibacterium sp. H-BE7]